MLKPLWLVGVVIGASGLLLAYAAWQGSTTGMPAEQATSAPGPGEVPATPAPRHMTAPATPEQAGPAVQQDSGPAGEDAAPPALRRQVDPATQEQAGPVLQRAAEPVLRDPAATTPLREAAPTGPEAAVSTAREQAGPVPPEQPGSAARQAAPATRPPEAGAAVQEEQAQVEPPGQPVPAVRAGVETPQPVHPGPALQTEAETGVPPEAGTGVRERAGGVVQETADPAAHEEVDSAAPEEVDTPQPEAAEPPPQDEVDPAPPQEAAAALHQEAELYVARLGEASRDPIEIQSAAAFVPPDQPVAAGGKSAPARGGARDSEAMAAAAPADAPGLEPSGGARVDTVPSAKIPAPGTAGPAADARPPEFEASEAPVETASGVTGAAGSGAARPGAAAAPAAGTRPPTIDLPATEQAPPTIADLLGPEESIPPDAVLYVHTVQPGDDEGIWGIVRDGIRENFAQGVAVHRGDAYETYQVDIPPDADEIRADQSSSFLGKLIADKTEQSLIYNYETGRIDRNPHLIYPGEEIVIVSFTPRELVAVYKHFVQQGPAK